ncbi:OmpH family outer membrane protein [Petrimonas sp.]|jgi:outer membrane protein|uniref:OmpH family outer membrane protein n=1 Tax=Petrimonas sp. TaxID=2023866 RepID=UPI002B256855|nr:OmpH family outer membrane protein [Petrimonas sp.]
MTKKLIILLFAIVPIAAFAQNVKLAHVNTSELFNQMPEIPGIETQLNNKQEEISKNGQALVDEFNKKAEEFQKLAPTSSETVKADQQKQLDQIQERYQMFVQNSQREMEELRQKLLAPIQQKIADAIKAVGDEKGYTYIFDLAAGNLVYVSTTAEDATPLVKSKLGIK